jgi:hypothetical protein
MRDHLVRELRLRRGVEADTALLGTRPQPSPGNGQETLARPEWKGYNRTVEARATQFVRTRERQGE